MGIVVYFHDTDTHSLSYATSSIPGAQIGRSSATVLELNFPAGTFTANQPFVMEESWIDFPGTGANSTLTYYPDGPLSGDGSLSVLLMKIDTTSTITFWRTEALDVPPPTGS